MAAILDNQYVGLRAFGQVTAVDGAPNQWKVAVYGGPFQEGTSEITRTTAIVDENTLSIVPAPPGEPLPGELALFAPDIPPFYPGGGTWGNVEGIRASVIFWATSVVLAPEVVALILTVPEQRLVLAYPGELRRVEFT